MLLSALAEALKLPLQQETPQPETPADMVTEGSRPQPTQNVDDLISLSEVWTPLDEPTLDLQTICGWRVRVVRPHMFYYSNRCAHLPAGNLGTISSIFQLDASHPIIVRVVVQSASVIQHNHHEIEIKARDRGMFEVRA